jgi:phosphonate transport system permease protein
LVGAGGLGRLLAEQIASFDYRGMTSTLLAFFVLTVLIDWGSAWARRVWG